MKQYLKTILSFMMASIFLCSSVFSYEITFEEVVDYIGENTFNFYEPPNEEMNKWIIETYDDDLWALPEGIEPNHDGYEYAALDIKRFCEDFDLDLENMIDCWEKGDVCIIPDPQTKVYRGDDYRVLRIGDPAEWSLLYLFFKENYRGEWIYFDKKEFRMQKYEEPELVFLDDGFFYIIALTSSGTGILSYDYVVYKEYEGELAEVLRIPEQERLSGWGLSIEREIFSDFQFYSNTVIVDYNIKLTAVENTVKAYGFYPLFWAERRAVFNWDGREFKHNPDESNVTLEDLDNFYGGGDKEYYEMFRKEFDQIGPNLEMIMDWKEMLLDQINNEDE